MRLLLPLFLFLTGCAAQPVPSAAPQASAAETVAYPSSTATLHGLLYRPAGPGPFAAVVVVHGDFGRTDGVKEQARRLADRGYLALAVDLYRGQVVTDLLDAHIMDRGLPDDRVHADLKAAADYLSGR